MRENVSRQEKLKLLDRAGFKPGNQTYNDGWPYVNHKGTPLKHWENTKYLCNILGISFKHNELTKRTESDFGPYKNLSPDSVITDLRGKCTEYGYSLSKNDAADHILRMGEENSYNPVRDYLNECLEKWDGKTYTRKLFEMFVLNSDSTQDPEFLYKLFEKWLITAALLPFNKGEDAAQGVLVIVGPQGVGKTRVMFKLLPNPKWGKTGRMIDLRDKDSVIQALGYWLVELGEYGRSLTAEKSDHYKAFITDSSDTFRTPYSRAATEHPRTTVFYATTDTDNFLRDDAGERRNWIISVVGINDVDVDMDQLWGEVAHLALVEKRPYWLTKEEIEKLNFQNEAYKVRIPEYQELLEELDWNAKKSDWVLLTANEICRYYGIDRSRIGYVGRALTQMAPLGVVKSPDTGKKKYLIPPFKHSYVMENIRINVRDIRQDPLWTKLCETSALSVVNH